MNSKPQVCVKWKESVSGDLFTGERILEFSHKLFPPMKIPTVETFGDFTFNAKNFFFIGDIFDNARILVLPKFRERILL